jgi:hypothetical protein
MIFSMDQKREIDYGHQMVAQRLDTLTDLPSVWDNFHFFSL